MIVGKTHPGGTTFAVVADTKRVSRFAFPVGGLVPKLSVYLDGGGAGAGPQSARPVIYTAAGVLVAGGDELVIAAGRPAGWVDFPFVSTVPGGALLAASGSYDLGLIVSAGNVIRLYGDAAAAATSRTAADTYSDGPAATFGTPTTFADDLSVYCDIFQPYAAPANELEFYYGRLPLTEGQKKFAETAPIVGTSKLVTASWHGTRLDPERGSFMVVQQDGLLSSLVGERVKVTALNAVGKPRIVYAYVHNELEIDAVNGVQPDLSLPRRLFSVLDVLGRDSIRVIVEKLS